VSGFGVGFGFGFPYGLDEGTGVPLPIDHVTAAALRLFEFQKERPNTETVMRTATTALQSIENAIVGAMLMVPLEDAQGFWLNIYGKIVDLPRRPTWTDDQYRFYIQTKLVALRSSGTAPDLLRVARRMVPETTDPLTVRFIPEYPAGYRMVLPDIAADLQGLAAELMSIATMAGVRGILVFTQPAANPNTFAFSQPGTVHGFGNGRFAHSVEVVGTLGNP